jgi:hypothetical protein
MYFVVEGRLEYDEAETPTEHVDKGEDWIAEPMLWTRGWTHLGLLMASVDELLIADPLNPKATLISALKVWALLGRGCDLTRMCTPATFGCSRTDAWASIRAPYEGALAGTLLRRSRGFVVPRLGVAMPRRRVLVSAHVFV